MFKRLLGTLRFCRVCDPTESECTRSSGKPLLAPPLRARLLAAVVGLSFSLIRPRVTAALLGILYLGFLSGYFLGGNFDKSGLLVASTVGLFVSLLWVVAPRFCDLAKRVVVAYIAANSDPDSRGFMSAAWTAALTLRAVKSPGFHSDVLLAYSHSPYLRYLVSLYSREVEALREFGLSPSSAPSVLVLPYAFSLECMPAVVGLSESLSVSAVSSAYNGAPHSLTALAVVAGKGWSPASLDMAAAMAPSWSGDLYDLLRAAESLV